MSTPSPLARAMRYYRREWGWVLLGFALASITLLAQIGLLAMSGWFIAAMGIAGAAGATMNYFTPGAIIRGLAMLRTGGRYAERLVTHEATLRMTTHLRNDFYARLEALAPAGIADLHSADLFGRLRADIDILERFFLQSLLPLAVSLFTLALVIGALLWFDPWLAAGMASLLLLCGFGLPWLQAKRTRAAQAELATTQAQLRQHLAETLQGRADLLVYGQAAPRLAEAERCCTTIAATERRIFGVESLGQGLLALGIGLGVMLGLARGFQLLEAQQIAPAYLAMLPLLCLGCFDTIAALPAALPGFPAARGAATRLYAILDRPIPIGGTAALPTTQPWQLSAQFAAVEGRLRAPIALSLQAGEVLALTGPSGAGKTSLLHWITGLLPTPESASISIHGAPIAATQPDAWRSQFAVAEQRPTFFTGTLRDNLRIAATTASDGDMEAACALAQFPLAAFTGGLDYELEAQAANLSGGQRRRLAVARALLHPAPCLLLDEPTEGLDEPLARAMMQAILAHAQAAGQAVLLITHQPAIAAMAGRQRAL